MPSVIDEAQLIVSGKLKQLYSAYMRNREVINIGMYQRGADHVVDEAIQRKDMIENFLRQGMNEASDMRESLERLVTVFG